MASNGYRGFINRLVAGSEKSEGYARAKLPSNRWELFWDIFKGRFGKLFLINLLTMLFFIPLALLIFFRYMSVVSLGMVHPFATGFGVGYQAPSSMAGLVENIAFSSNLTAFLLLPLALMIAAVGLSGGFYIIRNLVWTEGIFIANDFWRGIAQNIKQMLIIMVTYSVFLYLSILTISLCNAKIASGEGAAWVFYMLIGLMTVVLVFITLMVLHMITLCVTYKYTFFQLIRNSFFFTIGNPITSIFFIALGALPFIFLLLGDFFMIVGVVVLLIFGFSLFMLVWTIYCQFLYDRFLNDRVAGAKKNRGIYEKVKQDQSDAVKKYREQIEIANATSSLSNRPIKPITDEELKLAELPQVFNRQDIEKLNESRKALYEDNERYIQEHLSDDKFAKTENTKTNLTSAEEERQKRIEKAKKELEKRNKK